MSSLDSSLPKASMSHVEEGKGSNGTPDFYRREPSIGLGVEAERRLTRSLLFKLDTRMLPMLAILFLFSFLDRTNIGNAKILGLTTDLSLSASQYSNSLAIFYAFYIASEVPSNLILKRLSPRLWLGILTFLWGVIAMSMVSNAVEMLLTPRVSFSHTLVCLSCEHSWAPPKAVFCPESCCTSLWCTSGKRLGFDWA